MISVIGNSKSGTQNKWGDAIMPMVLYFQPLRQHYDSRLNNSPGVNPNSPLNAAIKAEVES